MSDNRLSNEQITEIVNMINTAGYKKVTEELINRYGINYETFKYVLRKEGRYSYDRKTKQYYLIEDAKEPFMSIEELTYKRQATSIQPISNKNTTYLESLYNELIQERLLEYHKFITFNREEKHVSINLSYLNEQGFQVETR